MRAAIPTLLLLGIALAAEAHAAGPRPAEPPRTVTIAASVEARAVTSGAAPVQVLFADGTTITLGRGSALTVDRYTYDTAAGAATLAATLAAGTFRLVGGAAAKAEGGVSLATPFGTLAIQSAAADISLAPGAAHFDMLFGDALRLARDGRVLATVRKPGYSIVPAANGGASVEQTRPEWRAAMQATLSRAAASPVDLPHPEPAILRPQSPHASTPQSGRSRP